MNTDVEHSWNDTDRPKDSKINVSKCRFVHNKFLIERVEIESGFRHKNLATNRMIMARGKFIKFKRDLRLSLSYL